MTRKKGLWIALFIFSILIVATLATTWNVVLVQHYQNMVSLAQRIETPPWVSFVLGTAGFVVVLGLVVLFFVKMLLEMRLNQRQTEFLAKVSHELKTPISTIELSASILKKGDASQKESERLWDLHETELIRLKTEVETLLEASRADAQMLKPDWQDVHLETWLETSLAQWSKILGREGKISRVGPTLERSIESDAKLLRLVADNLIENARKFSAGKPQVTIRTEVQGNEWSIHFEDEGKGFPPELNRQIFKRFFRASKATDQEDLPSGNGLGLYFSMRACRQLGIHLSAQSQGPGTGSIFTLRGYFE